MIIALGRYLNPSPDPVAEDKNMVQKVEDIVHKALEDLQKLKRAARECSGSKSPAYIDIIEVNGMPVVQVLANRWSSKLTRSFSHGRLHRSFHIGT